MVVPASALFVFHRLHRLPALSRGLGDPLLRRSNRTSTAPAPPDGAPRRRRAPRRAARFPRIATSTSFVSAADWVWNPCSSFAPRAANSRTVARSDPAVSSVSCFPRDYSQSLLVLATIFSSFSMATTACPPGPGVFMYCCSNSWLLASFQCSWSLPSGPSIPS